MAKFCGIERKNRRLIKKPNKPYLIYLFVTNINCFFSIFFLLFLLLCDFFSISLWLLRCLQPYIYPKLEMTNCECVCFVCVSFVSKTKIMINSPTEQDDGLTRREKKKNSSTHIRHILFLISVYVFRVFRNIWFRQPNGRISIVFSQPKIPCEILR